MPTNELEDIDNGEYILYTPIKLSHPSESYEFLCKITDGSASKIFKGKNKDTGDIVIIKRIPYFEEWRHELIILKKLIGVPKVLQYIEEFRSDRYVYLVTKFYEGYDLYEHIDINVPYEPNYGKKLIREMAECIRECHDRGIVHLDIKCENYILTQVDPPQLILIDFGHAEITTMDVMKTGYSKYGTSFYLCPEGYAKFYSCKSDIWSLGVCSYLILHGDYPFPNHKKSAREGKIELSPNLDDLGRDFFQGCLTHDPRDRFTIEQVLGHPFLNVASPSNTNY